MWSYMTHSMGIIRLWLILKVYSGSHDHPILGQIPSYWEVRFEMGFEYGLTGKKHEVMMGLRRNGAFTSGKWVLINQ